ncbi:MAG: protein kinase family protein [Muribaculaceae bacterium]|nr:protein kinase family protein [Muribaculaceae bacterium]
MPLPNKTQISNAVENSSSFIASQLKGYKAETGILGPNHYSGGFCIVFPIKKGKDRKALRVWHTEISNIKERYRLISDDIANAKLPFLSNVEYIENGLQVGTEYVDIVLMDWIDGLPLKKHIEQVLSSANSEIDKQQQLRHLAGNLLQVFKSLHIANFAHGDLQHDNIIVKADGSISLIDYDNFYTQSLQSIFVQTTTGYDGYQHPNKKKDLYSSKKDDYFAELVIYLSILSFAEDFSLWDISKDDEYALLLTNSDYLNLQQSAVFQKIKQFSGELPLLCDILEEYIKLDDTNKLKPFEILLEEKKIQFKSSATKAIRNSQQIEVSWSIPFEAEISITKVGKGDPQVCQNTGSIKTTLDETTTYELIVQLSYGQVIKKQLTIEVFDECEITFNADKYYIFPSIPVVLSWAVKNAKQVWLDDEKVSNVGDRIVEPSQAITYVLRAEDEFGIKEKRIDIRLLPIPQVKSLLVPAPNMISNLSLSIKQPRYNVGVRFPTINLGFIKTVIPKVSSLTDLGLKVELIMPRPISGFKRTISKLYNFIKQ